MTNDVCVLHNDRPYMLSLVFVQSWFYCFPPSVGFTITIIIIIISIIIIIIIIIIICYIIIALTILYLSGIAG